MVNNITHHGGNDDNGDIVKSEERISKNKKCPGEILLGIVINLQIFEHLVIHQPAGEECFQFSALGPYWGFSPLMHTALAVRG